MKITVFFRFLFAPPRFRLLSQWSAPTFFRLAPPGPNNRINRTQPVPVFSGFGRETGPEKTGTGPEKTGTGPEKTGKNRNKPEQTGKNRKKTEKTGTGPARSNLLLNRFFFLLSRFPFFSVFCRSGSGNLQSVVKNNAATHSLKPSQALSRRLYRCNLSPLYVH